MSEETAAAGRSGNRRGLRRLLLIGVPLVAAVIGVAIYATGGRYVTAENAYVKADIVTVSTDVEGRVIGLPIEDHQRVKEGDLLFRIDPESYEIALALSAVELEMVKDRIAVLRANYRAAKIAAEDAQEQLRLAQRDYERQVALKNRGVASAQKLDQALKEVSNWSRQARSAAERVNETVAELGGDPEILTEKHPMYLKALAERNQAKLDLDHTEVYAPADGIIANLGLEVGEWLDAGAPAFSLIETGDIWIEANIKETSLTYLQVGHPATFVVDAYPDVMFHAEVSSISPASGSEFALLPPQNATGNWVKVVQRVPVRLRILDAAGKPTLRAGMTVTVDIDTGRRRGLFGFGAKAATRPDAERPPNG
jgi:membrane fusion protein (multidrug efflux system)